MPDGQGLLADPSIGGGTSSDVAREMGIRFKGTDLHRGFNLLTDDFSSFLGEQAELVWWHPPYWNMITYSGDQWGEENPWDLSRLGLPDFVEALQLATMNIHDACRPGGYYGILMGNLRRDGEYYNLSSLVERIAPAKLVDEIIKTQHNCLSDARKYNSKIVRIAHEKLLVFRKDDKGALYMVALVNRRAQNMVKTTWKAAVRRALQGRQMSLKQLYIVMEPFAVTTQNNHWQAKVRQVVQDERFFTRVDKGVYRLAA
ncbi:hypothetical protein [Pseudovibrio sp. Ad37]|uniref:hypothetical protein n=1 Tax=Pseudovibrio sp. Ad37 TaxID=989422 RepID=UPI0019D38412|nr:hypothetical protein [Pseudovibrio sp. Ad37]